MYKRQALTHAVEAYIGRFYNTAETRRMAERAVAGIFRHLPEVCRDGGNLGARQAMLAASYQAGFAFTRAGVGNVHAIAHTLGEMCIRDRFLLIAFVSFWYNLLFKNKY